MPGIQVWWTAPNLGRWRLARELRDVDRGVLLVKPTGFVAKPQRKKRPHPTGVGEMLSRATYPALSGVLECAVVSHGGRFEVGQCYTDFVDGFSTTVPGRLWVMGSQGVQWGADFVLDAPIDTPVLNPWSPEMKFVRVSVPLVSDAGVWSSPVEVLAGSSVTVRNVGDLPMFPRVVWSGSGQWVRLPHGVTVQLPSVSGERVLSTDPGEGFAVTDRQGKKDKAAWAAMRGMPVPGLTMPGKPTTWGVSDGVRLECVHRIENPWR